MFKAIIDVETLVECFEGITVIVDEGLLSITEEGLHLRIVDRANVAMLTFSLSRAAFDCFEVALDPGREEIEVNLNFIEILEVIKLFSPGKLTIELNKEAVIIRSGTFVYSTDIISSDREIRKVPHLEFPVITTIAAEEFKRIVKAMYKICDDEFVFVADDGVLSVGAYGDTGILQSVIGKYLNAVTGIKSIHSAEYLFVCSKGMPNTTNVTVCFGNNYPIELTFNVAKGKGCVSYLIAPRIMG